MSTKELVMETVRKLPEQATFDQIIDEIRMMAKLQRALEQADAGNLIPHDEVEKRVATSRTSVGSIIAVRS